LKLWFVIRHYGAEGLRIHIEQGVASARWLADTIDADDRFERLAPTDLSLVCFAHRDGEEATEALLQRVNATGRAFLTHARLGGRYAIRVAVGGTYTRRADVERLWLLFDRET
jgi:aromatic-L-amino-acid decarboxylase